MSFLSIGDYSSSYSPYDDLQPGSALSANDPRDEEIARLRSQVHRLSDELASQQTSNIRRVTTSSTALVKNSCKEELRCNTCAKFWATAAVVSTIALGCLLYGFKQFSESSLFSQIDTVAGLNLQENSFIQWFDSYKWLG